MKAVYPVIVSRDLDACKRFYTSLFGFRSLFEVDFYLHLAREDGVQLGFVHDQHASIPDGWRRPAAGVFITIETDEVNELHERARALDMEIAYPLLDEEWGQRHFMVRDPNDLLVDVVKLIPPTPAFMERYGLAVQSP